MSEFFDALETRAPAEREAALMAALPAQIAHAQSRSTAMGEILNAESLMLVPFGEGGPAAERGDFTVGGRIPINPSGGLESKGHPIGATGLGQIHELVTQLRGEAGARQVNGARIAIQENGDGLCGVEDRCQRLHPRPHRPRAQPLRARPSRPRRPTCRRRPPSRPARP